MGGSSHVAPAGAADVELLLVTYAYPVAMVRVPLTDAANPPLTVTLGAHGGRIRVPGNRAYIVRANIIAPVRMFDRPRDFAVSRGGAYVEPASYAVCPEPRLTQSCRQDLEEKKKETE